MIHFKPARFLSNSHLQTIYPTLFSSREMLILEEEIFELPDGDFVECVWHKKPVPGEGRPIVVLFHGLAGSISSPYINRAMKTLGEKRYSVVLMQFRGCGVRQNRMSRSYHSGETGDAKVFLSYLQSHYHDSPLFAVGYSLGGNMLLKLLGEWGEASPLTGAMAVSAPMHLESSANSITKGASKFYEYHLLRHLRRALHQKCENTTLQKEIGLSSKEIKNLRTFWEFDDAYTAPIHGFSNAKTYYEKCSAKRYLKQISTPTLIIHAKDDPFMCAGVIPSDDELSKATMLEVYPHGGHMGFVSGSVFRPIYWLEGRMTAFFATIRPT